MRDQVSSSRKMNQKDLLSSARIVLPQKNANYYKNDSLFGHKQCVAFKHTLSVQCNASWKQSNQGFFFSCFESKMSTYCYYNELHHAFQSLLLKHWTRWKASSGRAWTTLVKSALGRKRTGLNLSFWVGRYNPQFRLKSNSTAH